MKIKFHYTQGVHYLAEKVVNYSVLDNVFHYDYVIQSKKGNKTIKHHSLKMDDLVFAEIVEEGKTTLIHGLWKKFDIQGTDSDKERQNKFESYEIRSKNQ